MKLPEPKQKDNGKWLIQVQADGKRVSKEFNTKDEAIYWATGIKTGQKAAARGNMTVGQAIDKYIESKDSVLSPSTVAGYKRIRDNHFQELMPQRLSDLTFDTVQRAVNKLSKEKSAKTVKNAYGLLTATINTYRRDLDLRGITLPQKEWREVVVPNEADIIAIAQAVKGKSVELPVILAMWLGLRMSEIRGLTWDCIGKDTITIKQARVDEGLKKTKTYSSNRVLPLPAYIKGLFDQLPRTDGFIFPDSRRAIHSRFVYWTEKAGIKHYRFHDLRHINASVMLALNVPNKYAMQRMGHQTDNMLKTVYQHTMSEETAKIAASVDGYFDKILVNATKNATKDSEPIAPQSV